MIATRASHFPVQKGDHLAGTRIIPLNHEKQKMEQAKPLPVTTTAETASFPIEKSGPYHYW